MRGNRGCGTAARDGLEAVVYRCRMRGQRRRPLIGTTRATYSETSITSHAIATHAAMNSVAAASPVVNRRMPFTRARASFRPALATPAPRSSCSR